MILGFDNFVNLRVDPVDLDILTLHGRHGLYHDENCFPRNLGGNLSLES